MSETAQTICIEMCPKEPSSSAVEEYYHDYTNILMMKVQPDDFQDLRAADLRDIKLRQLNTKDLKTIQKVILAEEARVLSLDEVLTRILEFYRRFLPFKVARADEVNR